ncbi:glycosyl hydrolase [Aeoliella sp.]|uniref:glycosyl hydrolase n=1 Tax=Aeoliella sp. TaxID=2795800 RepID=UPI003CCB9A28
MLRPHCNFIRTGGLSLVALSIITSAAMADTFHGLNAGAPVWNGSVLLSPQAANAFAATGTESIRVNFRLDAGATSWNANQLAMYDQVVANARNAGLEILGLFSNETVAGGQVAWNDDLDGDGLNSYVANFASTAELLVDRYQTDIRTFEIWNEPNAWSNPNYASDPQNAGGTYILPRVYANVLSETYRALADSSLVGPGGVQLATGGLLAHDIGGSFSTAMPYMQQVYDQSSVWSSFQNDYGREYPWDKFGYHFYISQGTPLATSQIDSYFNAVRSGQAANNDSSDVIVTEFSWQTVSTNTQEFQRDNMAIAYDYMEAQPYITRTYWYAWTDDVTGAWGLVDGNGQPKLSYDEFVARNGGQAPRLVATTEHAMDDSGLSVGYSTTDLLAGLIPTELAGDNGWHPANPAAGDPGDPNGLAAFTDGAGDLGSGLTGLLNDFPPIGAPTKTVLYDLEAPHDIDEIRIFTGNNGKDGRIFSATAIYTSADGETFDLLGYFQSDPSGTVNSASTPGGPLGSTLVTITQNDLQSMATGVEFLRFDMYAASDVNGLARDPFDGVNPFTGIDDVLTEAYVSPLVREIDVFGSLSTLLAGDFNGDGVVNLGDYTVWRNNLGAATDEAINNSGDGSPGVTAGDYQVWKDHFGQSNGQAQSFAGSQVPEPATLLLLATAVAICFRRAR